MKNIKNLIWALALLLVCDQFAHAQSAADFPKASDLKVPSDYPKYKDAVLKCIDWLETTPVDPNSEDRKQVNKFVLKWITGQSGIELYMGPNIAECTKGNPDLLVIFLGGLVKYGIEHPNEKDKAKLNFIGTQEIIKVYKANAGIKKDDKMDNLVQLQASNKLEKYLADQAQIIVKK
jgi:hypothetical protein